MLSDLVGGGDEGDSDGELVGFLGYKAPYAVRERERDSESGVTQR